MNSSLLRYFFLTCLFVAAALPGRASVRLYAAYNGAIVKLQWHPVAWGDEQLGYTLKRRLADDKLVWTELRGAEALRPSVDYERDWTKLGFTSKQGADINEHIRALKMNERPKLEADKVQQWLRENKAFPAGDGISMMRDAANAFAWGLGWVDNTVEKGRRYEYALFTVDNAGKESSEPVAVVRPLDSAARAEWVQATECQIAPRISAEELNLQWRMPLQQARVGAIGKFIVERRLDSESTWTVVNSELPYKKMRKEEYALWGVKQSIDNDMRQQAVHYRLTPVDVFQEAMESHEYTITDLSPAKVDTAKYGPSGIRASIVEGRLQLEWKQDALVWNFMELREFRFRPEVGIDRGERLGLSDARKAVVELSGLREGRAYSIDAVFADWDGVEQVISSENTVDWTELVKAAQLK